VKQKIEEVAFSNSWLLLLNSKIVCDVDNKQGTATLY